MHRRCIGALRQRSAPALCAGLCAGPLHPAGLLLAATALWFRVRGAASSGSRPRAPCVAALEPLRRWQTPAARAIQRCSLLVFSRVTRLRCRDTANRQLVEDAATPSCDRRMTRSSPGSSAAVLGSARLQTCCPGAGLASAAVRRLTLVTEGECSPAAEVSPPRGGRAIGERPRARPRGHTQRARPQVSRWIAPACASPRPRRRCVRSPRGIPSAAIAERAVPGRA